MRKAWCLGVLLLLLVAGCGSGGNDGVIFNGAGGVGMAPVTPSSPEQPTGTVVIQQRLLARALPTEVARQRFLGFNASDVLVYGPVLRDKAATITLDEVPVTVARLQMQLLDANGVITGIGSFDVTVTEGQTTVVDDPPFS